MYASLLDNGKTLVCSVTGSTEDAQEDIAPAPVRESAPPDEELVRILEENAAFKYPHECLAIVEKRSIHEPFRHELPQAGAGHGENAHSRAARHGDTRSAAIHRLRKNRLRGGDTRRA